MGGWKNSSQPGKPCPRGRPAGFTEFLSIGQSPKRTDLQRPRTTQADPTLESPANRPCIIRPSEKEPLRNGAHGGHGCNRTRTGKHRSAPILPSALRGVPSKPPSDPLHPTHPPCKAYAPSLRIHAPQSRKSLKPKRLPPSSPTIKLPDRPPTKSCKFHSSIWIPNCGRDA